MDFQPSGWSGHRCKLSSRFPWARRSVARVFGQSRALSILLGSCTGWPVQRCVMVRAVIIAINAWTGQLLPELAPMIVPVLEQMLAYEPLAPLFSMGIGADLVDG